METKRSTMKPAVSVSALGSVLVFLAFGLAGNSESRPPIVSAAEILMEAQPISSLPVIIDQPGSYYLARNLILTSADQNAIEVNADNVTIDLGGYSLIGPGPNSGTSHAIHMIGRKNVEICNGTVTGFGSDAIYEEDRNVARGHRVIAVRAISNGGSGIVLEGGGHLVRDCSVSLNCVAEGNWWGGIRCGFACTVTDNVVYGNGANGIVTDSGCTIYGNTVGDNTFVGISPFYGCTVTGNTAVGNFHGIYCDAEGVLIKENTLRWNQDAGIFVRGTHNAVEKNLATACNVGIYFETPGQFYADNRAFGNMQNYGGAGLPAPDSPGDGGGNVQFGTLPGGNINAQLQKDVKTHISKTVNTQ